MRYALAVMLWVVALAVWAQTASDSGASTVQALRTAGLTRVTESEGTVRATVPGDSLWEIAGAATGHGLDRNQVMVAIMRRNPEAFPQRNLHRIERGLSLVIPPLSEMRREDPRQAAALVAQHRAAYLNKAVAPMPMYALAGGTAASVPATSAAAGGTPMPASSALAGADRNGAQPGRAVPGAPGAAVPWAPVSALLVVGAGAGALLWRRRGAGGQDAAQAAVDRGHSSRVSRMFADSRLALESQLQEQPPADSEPLYSTLDEPVDVLPAAAPSQGGLPLPALVLRHGDVPDVSEASEVSVLTGSQALASSAPSASGGALALALTVAHAYADVGRPEAARRWLRAIDARGAGAFQQSG